MKVGELFINLGIKGADKAKDELNKISSSIGEVVSSSLAAKAAIVGAMYAFERLSAGSAATGTSLENFAALTHGSIIELQKWEYGMRQAGMTGEETKQGLTNLQKIMGDLAAGKGVPEGFGRIANVVGIDPKRIGDMIYMMGKFREYAKATSKLNGTDLALANTALESVGFGAFTAAARRGKLDENILNKAPVYSTQESRKLADIDGAWKNLGHEIEMTIGKLNAKHGLQLVKDLESLVKQVMKLTDALATLAERLKVFKALGFFIEGLSTVAGAYGSAVEAFNSKTGKNKAGNNFITELAKTSLVGQLALGAQKAYTIHSTVNNYGVKDADHSGAIHKKALRDVINQSQAKARAN